MFLAYSSSIISFMYVRYCLPSGKSSSRFGFGRGSIAFHEINKRTMLNPRFFRRSNSDFTDSISFFKSSWDMSLVSSGAIGRYGGSLLLEPKFTPLKRVYLACSSLNQCPLFQIPFLAFAEGFGSLTTTGLAEVTWLLYF